MRKWRNWQTHHLEGVALARAYGFKSRLPHTDILMSRESSACSLHDGKRFFFLLYSERKLTKLFPSYLLSVMS